MGKPTIKPARLIAQAGLPCPVFFKIESAMTLVLPLCSNSTPNVVPSTMIRLNDLMILANPSLTRLIVSAGPISEPVAVTKQAIKSAKNAGTRNLTVRKRITEIPASMDIITWKNETAIPC